MNECVSEWGIGKGREKEEIGNACVFYCQMMMMGLGINPTVEFHSLMTCSTSVFFFFFFFLLLYYPHEFFFVCTSPV